MRKVLICYDIHDNRRRTKVAKIMEAAAERVQGSVFEAFLTEKQQEELQEKLKKKIDEEEDSVRFYPLCIRCREAVVTLGRKREVLAPAVVVV